MSWMSFEVSKVEHGCPDYFQARVELDDLGITFRSTRTLGLSHQHLGNIVINVRRSLDADLPVPGSLLDVFNVQSLFDIRLID